MSGEGLISSGLGLALGAQPFPPESPVGGEDDRTGVLVPACVLSLHFCCGRVASLGGVLCAGCRCVSGLCVYLAGSLCALERGCWTPGTRWLPLAHSESGASSGLNSSPTARGWWQRSGARPWRAAPRLLDESGCMGLRTQRGGGVGQVRAGWPAGCRPDWMGVRWRPGKLCEPVFGGGVV